MKKYDENERPFKPSEWTAADYWSTWRWLLVALQNGELQQLKYYATKGRIDQTWDGCPWCRAAEEWPPHNRECIHTATLNGSAAKSTTELFEIMLQMLSDNFDRPIARPHVLDYPATLRFLKRQDDPGIMWPLRMDMLLRCLRTDILKSGCPLYTAREARLRKRRIATFKRFPLHAEYDMRL